MSASDQPGGRLPAPGALAHVQDFLNTADLEGGTDALSARAFTSWAHRHGLPEIEQHRLTLIQGRELLRDWISTGTTDVPGAVAEWLAPLQLRFDVTAGRLQVTADSQPGLFVAPIIDAIRTAIDDGTWPRLKTCDRDICRWVFYDHSKNAASHWCASSICGAREKARRAYARRTNNL